MVGGIRGIIRDIFILYLGYRLIKVWLFNDPFTTKLGLLVALLFFSAAWFILERTGLVPRVL